MPRYWAHVRRRWIHGTTIAAAVVALVAGAGTAAQAASPTSSTVFQTAGETWSTTRHPDTPQYHQGYLSATNSADKTYLKFPTASLKGKTVTSARLTLKVLSTMATAGGVEVFKTNSSWNPSTLTDHTRPSAAARADIAPVKAAAGKTISVPVSPSAIAAGGTTAFELRYSQAGVSVMYAHHPTLSVTTAAAPQASAAPAKPSPSPTKAAPSPAPTGAANPAPAPTTTSAPAPAAASSGSNSTAMPVAVKPNAAGATSKAVFAHYFPAYPISLDNKPAASDYYSTGYLNPSGEGGAHAAYGGLLRDRPLPQANVPGDWRLADAQTEVAQASSAGIDGFMLDVLSLAGQNWTYENDIMKAAAQTPSFRVAPELDMTTSVGSSSPSTVADSLHQLWSTGGGYRLSDGRYLLSGFEAEKRPVAWWQSLISTLGSKYGTKVAFVPTLLNPSDANMSAFAPISYGLGSWGVRTPSTIASAPNYAAKAHALGVKWMAPVAVQDVRPRSAVYAEADNTEALRDGWSRAISDGADMVQIPTWNDYSEGTSIAPSEAHGYSFLQLNAYYEAQFKSGSTPAIAKNLVVVTHRNEFHNAVPARQSKLMLPTLCGTSTPPRDDVEILTLLKTPGTVTAQVGGVTTNYTAPAGLYAKLIPLQYGSVSVRVAPSGSAALSVSSPEQVVKTPTVQDLQYYASSAIG
jgi:hypothetical protein